jgi:hypothetical protein
VHPARRRAFRLNGRSDAEHQGKQRHGLGFQQPSEQDVHHVVPLTGLRVKVKDVLEQ